MNKYVNDVINLAFRVSARTETEIEMTKKDYYANKTELLDVATKKKVLPVLAKYLCDLEIDTGEWSRHYHFFQERNARVIQQISEVFAEMQESSITKIAAYENFGILLLSQTDTALYSSGDVDLFADVTCKERIVSAMKHLGYTPTEDKYHRRNLMTEFLKDGAPVRVNIGWKVLRRNNLPIKIFEQKVELWNQTVYYKDSPIRLLAKDALLYLCLLRIAVHGYSRSPDVRLYIDIQNAVCTQPDWDRVLQWAADDGVLTKVVTVSYLANRLNGVAVPDKVLQMVEKDRFAKRIIALVYDDIDRTLKYEPKGFRLFRLEAASDNKSVLGELFTVLFPPKAWLADFYREAGEGTAKSYINYYKHFFGK